MPKRTEAGLPVLRMRPVPKGRTFEAAALEEVRELLGVEPRRRDLLIEHLHRIQDATGHLSDRHLLALAHEMGLTAAEVYEVATFYHHFDVVKDGADAPPALTIRVCDSIACELAGAADLLRELTDRLGSTVRVTAAPCIGRCEQAPAALVGDRPVGHATAAKVEGTVLEESAPSPAYTRLGDYLEAGGYDMLRSCADGDRGVESVMETVGAAGLKGLGGAGFPASRKWEFVRNEPGPRLMVVNADEGEPGTFKDRHIMETDPHRMLEGMLIAAWVVDAAAIYIYLRDEYPVCRRIMEEAIAELRSDPPVGDLPEIHLRRGAGAYICGEETALIESLEGKRGEPRLRPPFPAQSGVFGRPTLVHNVETLYWLPEILRRGGEWFAEAGKRGHQGRRLFSVSGRVKEPGIYEAANGATVRELIEMAGGMADGHEFYAYLPGGASGGILPASLGDVPLDFGGALGEYGCFVGSGAIVVLGAGDSAKSAALNLMRFFAHESCGKCTPCRVGTAKSVKLMESPEWDQALLDELGVAMADASICGLGQAAPNVVRRTIEHFPDEFEGRGGTA